MLAGRALADRAPSHIEVHSSRLDMAGSTGRARLWGA